MTAALNIVAEIQLRLSRFGFFYFLQVLIQKIVCLIYIWLTVKFLTALDWDLFNRVVQEYLWKRIMATGKNVFFCQNSEKQKMAPLFQYLLIFLVSIGLLHCNIFIQNTVKIRRK